ncbi:hypothetical protein GUJ93_ZPchr0011g27502 [Zizania palustris]|uniref:Uncharacterized protein n=1 Tax=Zizania palustris TaxID=103762 RepID=A0A8J6BL71_ZIZPA|nr:hypothetical protein GUJ93_ZPchr0011g27502 [Zizania palustris]
MMQKRKLPMTSCWILQPDRAAKFKIHPRLLLYLLLCTILLCSMHVDRITVWQLGPNTVVLSKMKSKLPHFQCKAHYDQFVESGNSFTEFRCSTELYSVVWSKIQSFTTS